MPKEHVTRYTQLYTFHRNQFRLAAILAIILLIVCFGFIGYIYYQFLTIPTPPYFVTTSDGRLIEIRPNN